MSVEALQPVLGDLQRLKTRAWVRYAAQSAVQTTTVLGVVLGDAVVSPGMKGRLEMLDKQVARLDWGGDLGGGVVAGTFDAKRWLAIAGTTYDGYVGELKSLGESLDVFSRVWGEIVVPTATTVHAGATKAVEAAPGVLVLVVVGLVALAALQVVPILRGAR